METYSETLGGVGVNGNRLGIKVDMLYKRADEMTEARKVDMASINSKMDQAWGMLDKKEKREKRTRR